MHADLELFSAKIAITACVQVHKEKIREMYVI